MFSSIYVYNSFELDNIKKTLSVICRIFWVNDFFFSWTLSLQNCKNKSYIVVIDYHVMYLNVLADNNNIPT